MEDQIWRARDRAAFARTKRCLEVGQNTKVEIQELESLLGPDDMDVDFRRFMEEARGLRDLQLRRSE